MTASLGNLRSSGRGGCQENRSKAIDAALELLERRNARPTLEWALAHPLHEPGSPESEAARRDSEAIDALADALNRSDAEPASHSPAA
jgi:hypothetical protein